MNLFQDTPMVKVTRPGTLCRQDLLKDIMSPYFSCCHDDHSWIYAWFDLVVWWDGLIDVDLFRFATGEKALANNPTRYETHAGLLYFGCDVVHMLSGDPRIQGRAIVALLCRKRIALVPSMIKQIRRSWTIRRAISHHGL